MVKKSLKEHFQQSIDKDYYISLSKLKQNIEDQNVKDNNDAVSGRSEDVGRIPTNGFIEENNPNSHKNNSKKGNNKSDLLLILRDLEWSLRERLEGLQKQLEENLKTRDELNDQHAAIEEALDYYNEYGAFQLGEDGYPVNEKFCKAIENWEAKTGEKFDTNSNDLTDTVYNIQAFITERQRQENLFIQAINQKISRTSKTLENVGSLKSSSNLTSEQVDNIVLESSFVSDDTLKGQQGLKTDTLANQSRYIVLKL